METKILQALDKTANLYNKTKQEKYKEKWYKLLRMYTNENTNDTNTVIQWDFSKRKTRV
jgi:hypothetical protein